jgi:hypothetical protein
MQNSTSLVVRSVPVRLRHFLSDLWDYDFYRTCSAKLDAEQDVFWFDQSSDGYECEYRTTDDKLWSFVVDRTDLRRLANAQQTELEVEERQCDSDGVRVPLGVVRRLIADLIDSRELQLKARRDTVEHFHARQSLGEEMRDWIQARVELAERSEQKKAVADLVDWLLERPELDELYLADVDLYWMLRRRVWDVREELATSAAASPLAAIASLQPGPAVVDDATRYPSSVSQKEPKASRFQLLGLDFPLYEGTVSEACSYVGAAFCCIRQQTVDHAFELGVGDYLRISCTCCGAANFLDACEPEAAKCRQCKCTVAFPKRPGEAVTVGYDALRAGYAAMTKETEIGLVSWEHVQEREHAQGWELLRTPNFDSWNGEGWLFSRGHPMVYVGVWSQLEFIMYADNGDGRALFDEIVEDLPERELWGEIEPDGPVSVHVFRCQETGRLRAASKRRSDNSGR